MQYLALPYAEEDERSDPGSEAFAGDRAPYDQFSEHAGDAIVAGESLSASSEAVTIRRRAGEVVVTDGPYSETTEVLGGLYVMEADDLDAAVELARRIPAAEHGAVEVRPLAQWFQEHRPLPEGTRRYLAVLIEPETAASRPGTEAWEAAAQDHGRFGVEAGEALAGGAALHPAEAATTVKVRDGQLLLSDGPFIETAEVVGGLYLLIAASRQEAVALASRIPMGDSGTIEVRPIEEFDH